MLEEMQGVFGRKVQGEVMTKMDSDNSTAIAGGPDNWTNSGTIAEEQPDGGGYTEEVEGTKTYNKRNNNFCLTYCLFQEKRGRI